MNKPPENREAWLTEFAKQMAPLIKQRTGIVVDMQRVRLSVGFPSSGGRKKKTGRQAVGECHTIPPQDTRKIIQIFIHPNREGPIELGEVITHELLHAGLPHGTGHRKAFSQAAKAMGLLGPGAKPTSTWPNEELEKIIVEMAKKIGPYPHERLDAWGPTQKTRLLKAQCPMCGYVVRVTQKWLDEAGAPICPQDYVQMTTGEEEVENPLIPVEAVFEYKVKSTNMKLGTKTIEDPRWSIRMIRRGQEFLWWIVDYGPIITNDGFRNIGTGYPRLTSAENREDAIATLEGLRAGDITYEDIAPDPDIEAKLDAEWGLDGDDEPGEYPELDEEPADQERHDFENYTDEELEAHEKEWSK